MWSEGMFLLPQHFQYQDEFHQHQLAEATLRSTLSIGVYRRCRWTRRPG
jgi:predicted component of type VI protein secretion system